MVKKTIVWNTFSVFKPFLIAVMISAFPIDSTAQVLVRDRQEMVCRIEEERIFQFRNQEVSLGPFELFDLMVFQGIGLGMYTSLMFKATTSQMEIEFNDNLNAFNYDESAYDESVWIGSDVELILDMHGDSLIRNIKKGESYKVIYSFKSDSAIRRAELGACIDDGYYIVDILPIDTPFPRQKTDHDY